MWPLVFQGDGQGQLAVQVDAIHVLAFSMSNNLGLFFADRFDLNGTKDTVGEQRRGSAE